MDRRREYEERQLELGDIWRVALKPSVVKTPYKGDPSEDF